MPEQLAPVVCSLSPAPPQGTWPQKPPHLLSLEQDHRVGKQVCKVNLTALLDDVWMLPHQQPADVGEEEAAAGVVGVGVCL